MMATVVYIALLSALVTTSTAVEPQACPGPNEWFTAEFVTIADKLVPTSATILSPDVDLRFFREIMLFSEEEIEEATEDAVAFFNTKFGLDFSSSVPDELGQRFFENATFFAFEFSPVIEYTITFHRWLINGRTKSTCFPNRDGGFQVSFSSEQTLRGTYGGPEGKPIQPGELLLWGFYNIPVCPQQPLVIHYESGTPFRLEPIDGISVVNCDLYNRVLGEGTAQGIVISTPTDDPDVVHFSVRNLFTFPPNPGLPSN